MEFQPKTPHPNGNHNAPPLTGGASAVPPTRTATPTVFPEHVPLAGPSAVVYALDRFYIGGIPLSRLPIGLLVGLAFLWGVGALPGRWIGVGGSTLLLGLFLIYSAILRRRRFVAFIPSPPPTPSDPPLHPQEKLPVYATGLLTVEGKERPFTFLPGFYRTFATGEHAVLCHAAPRQWLALGAWPPDEQGMWYAFVQPDAVIRLAWGKLHFGVTHAPAIAITYRFESSSRRRGHPQVSHQTLYLACSAPADALRVFVDLHQQLPPGSIVTPLKTRARRHDPS